MPHYNIIRCEVNGIDCINMWKSKIFDLKLRIKHYVAD